MMPGIQVETGTVCHPITKQRAAYWTKLAELITREGDALSLSLARPCFLLPSDADELRGEVGTTVDNSPAFGGSLVISHRKCTNAGPNENKAWC